MVRVVGDSLPESDIKKIMEARMGLYKHVRDLWKTQSEDFLEMHRKRMTGWRSENATVRIDKPTRIDKARSLGYRAKPGVILVRQRVDRGGRMRPTIRSGRRTAHNYQRKILSKNYQQIAEERANDAYVNCEVLNSYFVGEDGIYRWYEVILLDRNHPVIMADSSYAGIARKKSRAYRGLTSAGRKSRGLRNKGLGAEKIRPSVRANSGRSN